MAWGRSIADFREVSLPSLLAPGNVPWLVANGHPTTLTVYTSENDIAELSAIVAAAGGLPGVELVFLPYPSANGGPNPALAKMASAEREMAIGSAAGARTFLALADVYYGDGTMRNLMRCAQGTHNVFAVPIVRVKREPFMRLLRTHQQRAGRTNVSNAELVDLALRAPIDCVANSRTDRDDNVSLVTSIALRELTANLWTMVLQVQSPLLCSFAPNDAAFFQGTSFNRWDAEWPNKLLAERRLRYAASSDIGFVVEVTGAEEEAAQHTVPTMPGMRDNEAYLRPTLQSEAARRVLMALRREPTLA